MNDDEFEDKLRALTAKLARPDPTPAWKADILARAHQSRERSTPRPPRILLTVLGAAWLFIAALRITTPADTSAPREVRDVGTIALQSETQMQMQMLMAFRADPELLDLQ